MPVTKWWKLQWKSGSKKSTEFSKQVYMLSFEDGIFLLRQTVTMFRNKDVIPEDQLYFDVWYKFLCR